MKKLLILFATFITTIIGVLASPSASFNGTTIALTPDVDQELAQEVFNTARRLIDSAPNGIHIRVISGGSNPVTISEWTKKKYPNQIVKQRQEKAHLTPIAQFLKQAALKEKSGQAMASLNVPEIVQAIANSVEGNTRLVFVGSPVLRSSDNSSFVDDTSVDDAKRWRLPSSGTLRASHLLTPLGITATTPQMPEVSALWFNPVAAKSGPRAFRAVTETWWAAYLAERQIKMATIHEDVNMFLGQAFSEDLNEVSPDYNYGGVTATMITLAELVAEAERKAYHSNRVIRPIPLGVFTVLWLADASPSQNAARETIARRIARQRPTARDYFGLILSDGGRALAYSEHRDPVEISAAFRTTPPLSGFDTAGSLSGALEVAAAKIKERNASQVSIRILSDVGPIVDLSRPSERQYPHLLKTLISQGHKIEFIRCNKSLDTSAFLPSGVTVKDL